MAVQSKTLWVVLIAAGCCAAALAVLPFILIHQYEASMRGTPKWHFSEGNVHLRQGDYDAAIEQYAKAIELMPEWADPYSTRGGAYIEKGEYDAAIKDFTTVIELLKAKPIYHRTYIIETYRDRGKAHFEKHEYDKAITDCTKAIELDPQYATAYKDRALAHYFRRDYDKAWADVQKCQRLGGTVDPEFLADLREASGREE